MFLKGTMVGVNLLRYSTLQLLCGYTLLPQGKEHLSLSCITKHSSGKSTNISGCSHLTAEHTLHGVFSLYVCQRMF